MALASTVWDANLYLKFADARMRPALDLMGRLYFRIPGGITYGQHWLNVKFENSLVRVPFRILTADEEKRLNKNYKSIKKQVEDSFKKKS